VNLPDSLFVVGENPGNTGHVYDREKDETPFRKEDYRTSLCGQAWARERDERSPSTVRGPDCGTCLRILDSRG